MLQTQYAEFTQSQYEVSAGTVPYPLLKMLYRYGTVFPAQPEWDTVIFGKLATEN